MEKGTYVIVRSRDAGVHAGMLEDHDGHTVTLTDSRRLWYWQAKQSAFLSGVANYGLANPSKVGARLNRVVIAGWCEIMECSSAAAESIGSMPEHTP